MEGWKEGRNEGKGNGMEGRYVMCVCHFHKCHIRRLFCFLYRNFMFFIHNIYIDMHMMFIRHIYIYDDMRRRCLME